MARGKHAVLSANRRAESAHQIIDRLTSELAEAKLRARLVEADAAQVPRLREQVNAAAEMAEEDTLLADAIEKLAWWNQVQKDDERRRENALRIDLVKLIRDAHSLFGITGWCDAYEFVLRRYPYILKALYASDDDRDAVNRANHPFRSASLSDDQIKRIQRACGTRSVLGWDAEKDAADLAIDVLDAQQAEFTKEMVLEYIGAPPT